MSREFRRLLKSLPAERTLERFLLRVGLLVGHELYRVRKVAVADVAGKKSIFQNALFIFCRVAQFQVALFTLVVTEDDMALNALQGELRCCIKIKRSKES